MFSIIIVVTVVYGHLVLIIYRVTRQLMVSQVADLSTHGLVNSLKCVMQNLQYIIVLCVISSKFHYLPLSLFDRVRVTVDVQSNCNLSMIFRNWLLAS